jgi:hypothetical protein
MPPLYDDEAMTPLVNSDGHHARSKKNGTGLMINRVLVIILAAAVVAVSTFFQAEQSQLSQLLASDEDKIKLLKYTVEAQGLIIQRFNESVTNTDVLKRLKLLEGDLKDTKLELKSELNQTISDVNAHLDNTMTVLDDTVKKAEKEIKDQVDIVKKDFEKYVIQTEDKFSMENSFMVFQLAGTITLLSCLISMVRNIDFCCCNVPSRFLFSQYYSQNVHSCIHSSVAHDGSYPAHEPASHPTKDPRHFVDVAHLRHHILVFSGIPRGRRLFGNHQRCIRGVCHLPSKCLSITENLYFSCSNPHTI